MHQECNVIHKIHDAVLQNLRYLIKVSNIAEPKDSDNPLALDYWVELI